MSEIIIYTNKGCSYCSNIKQELNNNNIEYTERDTTEFNNEWKKAASFTGVPTVPMVFFKNNYFAPGRDFSNPKNLILILNTFEELEQPIELQLIEKIKTLTYNTSFAFRTLDQLLKQIENKLNIKEDEHKSTN